MKRNVAPDNIRSLLFSLDGIPPFAAALPLALQHVVAMIVGCVTPAIIVASAAGLSLADRVLLIQASLVAAAFGTIVQPMCRLCRPWPRNMA